MAETHYPWEDTMGEPFVVPENPLYDATGIKRPTTNTPAHAAMFNEIFQRFITNTAAVKAIADSKAGTDIATAARNGLLSKEDKAKFDAAVESIASLGAIFGKGAAGGDLQGNYPNPTINPEKLAGIKPAFTQSGSRANITSGDSLAVALGKISKMYADLKNVAWSGSYADLSAKPSSFPPSSHTHDDRYYTESEMNTKLNAKANANHAHTAAQVGAAAASHTHPSTQITGLPVFASGTYTPVMNDAYNRHFSNPGRSGSWYRIGNIVMYEFSLQLVRTNQNSDQNMYCSTPFSGYAFGSVVLRAPTADVTFKKNWLLQSATKDGSLWMLKHGGTFAYARDMSTGADDWYYGRGVILL